MYEKLKIFCFVHLFVFNKINLNLHKYNKLTPLAALLQLTAAANFLIYSEMPD